MVLILILRYEAGSAAVVLFLLILLWFGLLLILLWFGFPLLILLGFGLQYCTVDFVEVWTSTDLQAFGILLILLWFGLLLILLRFGILLIYKRSGSC